MALRYLYFSKNIENKHLCHPDKNYYYFSKLKIAVSSLKVGFKIVTKASKYISV